MGGAGIESAVLDQIKRAQGDTNQCLEALIVSILDVHRRAAEPGSPQSTATLLSNWSADPRPCAQANTMPGL